MVAQLWSRLQTATAIIAELEQGMEAPADQSGRIQLLEGQLADMGEHLARCEGERRRLEDELAMLHTECLLKVRRAARPATERLARTAFRRPRQWWPTQML